MPSVPIPLALAIYPSIIISPSHRTLCAYIRALRPSVGRALYRYKYQVFRFWCVCWWVGVVCVFWWVGVCVCLSWYWCLVCVCWCVCVSYTSVGVYGRTQPNPRKRTDGRTDPKSQSPYPPPHRPSQISFPALTCMRAPGLPSETTHQSAGIRSSVSSSRVWVWVSLGCTDRWGSGGCSVAGVGGLGGGDLR